VRQGGAAAPPTAGGELLILLCLPPFRSSEAAKQRSNEASGGVQRLEDESMRENDRGKTKRPNSPSRPKAPSG
jgi:hypothetical protein